MDALLKQLEALRERTHNAVGKPMEWLDLVAHKQHVRKELTDIINQMDSVEPVAWVVTDTLGGDLVVYNEAPSAKVAYLYTPLYVTPPQQPDCSDLVEALASIVEGTLLDDMGNRDEDGLARGYCTDFKDRIRTARKELAKHGVKV